jgi:hypothetical protein
VSNVNPLRLLRPIRRDRYDRNLKQTYYDAICPIWMGFVSDPSDIASVVLAARFEKQITLFFDASDAKTDERIHLFNTYPSYSARGK